MDAAVSSDPSALYVGAAFPFIRIKCTPSSVMPRAASSSGTSLIAILYGGVGAPVPSEYTDSLILSGSVISKEHSYYNNLQKNIHVTGSIEQKL